MAKKNDLLEDWIIFLFAWILLLNILFVAILFFKFVSIGTWIAKESYIVNGNLDMSDWIKQVSLFIATMAGFSYFTIEPIKLIQNHFPIRRKNNGNNA